MAKFVHDQKKDKDIPSQILITEDIKVNRDYTYNVAVMSQSSEDNL